MSPASNGPFDLVFGLPLHIFVNHAVVVLLPLGAIALVLTVVVPALRRHYLVPALVIAILGAASAVIAEQSGEALEQRVGSAGQHGEWGEAVVPVALALVGVSLVWALIQRSKSAVMRVLSVIGGVGTILLSGAAVVLVVLTGHSGADLTWGGRVASEAGTEQPAQVEQDMAEEQPAEPSEDAAAQDEAVAEPAVLSEELVANNASAESCWSIVNGQVYDLTAWIDQHPGGSSRILGMCGRDATADFTGQHAGESGPEQFLQGYLLGSLGDPAP